MGILWARTGAITIGVNSINPLPTNDTPMRHGFSISHIRIYMEDLILGVILQYMVSAYFLSCFLWLIGKGLRSRGTPACCS